MFSAMLPSNRVVSCADVADRGAQALDGEVANVAAVDPDRSVGDVVEAQEELQERRLPGAGRPHQGDGVAGGGGEGDVADHRLLGVGRVDEGVLGVGEGDVVVLDGAGDAAVVEAALGGAVEASVAPASVRSSELDRVVVRDPNGDVPEAEDALAGRLRVLVLVDDVRHLGERGDELLGEQDERDERPDRERRRERPRRPGREPVAADREGGGEREAGEQLHPGAVDEVEPEDRHRPLEVLMRGRLDALALVRLGVGSLHQFDARERVLQGGVEVADHGALGDVPRLHGPHEPEREEDHQGDRGEGDEGELPVVIKEDAGDAGDHHAEPRRVLEGVVEEDLEVRGVVVEDAHHLARLLVVEERHVEPLHPVEGIGPDRVHHAVREVVRGDPVDPREHAGDEERADDEDDGEPELRRARGREPRVRDDREGVGTVAREHGIDGDAEHDRRDQPGDAGDDVRGHPDREPVGLGGAVLAEQSEEGPVDPVAVHFEGVALVGGHGSTSRAIPMYPTASVCSTGSVGSLLADSTGNRRATRSLGTVRFKPSGESSNTSQT